ncbi:MAG: pantoate--beta-alanine ligase [Planctomycetes bacterium]|nr:pantoate--beta-alanine ligase [Planctomycetota bacterium]
MQTVHSIPEMSRLVEAVRCRGKTLGFVPTMGALHEGHLSLVKASVAACDITAVSIFVNPTQFGPGEDLDRYPRDLKGDAGLLEKAGCDFLFTLEKEAMYPQGFQTWVEVEHLPNHLCGISRPSHFRGVATVVTKLFNIVRPHQAFFGWKDAQQALVIRQMTRDLNFPIEIRLIPTIRDSDGLALSSRNRYLTPAQRKAAQTIPKALFKARDFFENGRREAKLLLAELHELFEGLPETQVEYISLVSTSDLEAVDEISKDTMLALAVRVGTTRLIDNYLFAKDESCSE